MSSLRNAVLVGVAVAWMASVASAFTVTIDDFSEFDETGTLNVNFVDPTLLTALDTGLSGVLGGSRHLLVESTGDSPLLVIGGVLPSGVLDYMSIGTGRVRVTYDRNGAGLGALLARCNDSIEIAYLNADEASQGIGTGATEVILTLTGGASVSVPQVVSAEQGILSYPMSAFAGVNLQSLTSISLELDGRDSDSADLAIDSIEAIGCEPPPVPSPSVGPVALAFSVLMLAGLGLFALRRHSS